MLLLFNHIFLLFFVSGLTNIAKMKPMKDAVSRYADLARRRLSRKLKADEVHLIED